MIKPAYQKPIDAVTYNATLGFFDSLVRLLHPFMPFITEELWQALTDRHGESLMISDMPQSKGFNADYLSDFEKVKEIVSGIRTVRLQKNIPNKELLGLEVLGEYAKTFDSVIQKMGNLTAIDQVSDKSSGSVTFMVGTTEFAIPLGNNIDIEAELKKLEEELTYLKGFLISVQKKLSNEKFVANAKPEIVENERKKLADAESKIKTIEESIESLKK